MKNLLRLVGLWLLPLGLPASWAQAMGGSATVRGHVSQAPAGDTVWLEYREHLGRQAPHVRLSPGGNFEFVLPATGAPTHAGIQPVKLK
jgi:hypothetical protein